MMTVHVIKRAPTESGWFFKHGFPLTVSATIITILLSSKVPRNLLVIQGTAADVVLVAYAALLFWVAVVSVDADWVHKVGAVLAVFTWGGRGGGFIELGLDRGTWDLSGAVAERLLVAAALVLWHASMMYTVVADREYANGSV